MPQRSMHLRSLSVKEGQKVAPGEVIGLGIGAGNIFKAPDAGPPHVHSEFRHNGRPVEPYSGLELPFNPTADIKERERAAQKAKPVIKKPKTDSSPPANE